MLALAEQPILPLGGLGCFDEFGTYPVSVMADGKLDCMRAYYAGWTRCESVPFDTAIGMALEPMTVARPSQRHGRWPGAGCQPARTLCDQRPQESAALAGAGCCTTSPAACGKMVNGPRRAGLQDPHGDSRTMGIHWQRARTAT